MSASKRAGGGGSSLWQIRAAIDPRQYWLLALAGLVAPLVVWLAASHLDGIDKVFLPGPADVLTRIWSWASDDDLTADAVDEVGNPTILATLTVVAALLPMGFVSDMMGP